MPPMSHRNSAGFFLLFIIGFYFAFSLFNGTTLEEDAFIYFRCAENIRNGFGCVFNPMGERIEVCSSILWLFILAGLGKLNFDILIAAKISGIIIGGICLFLIYKITQLFTRSLPWVIVPSLLTSISLPFVMWNQMGLETALYTFFFLMLVFVCLNRSVFFYWPVVATLLVIARPEGLFILIGLLPAFYVYRQERRKIIKSLWVFFILLSMIIALRLWYFHDFFPSSFYHKIFPGKYKMGLSCIHTFFLDYYFYFLLPPFLYFSFTKKWRHDCRVIIYGFVIVHMLWLFLGGADYKPFFRHFVPLIPLVYIYLSVGLAQICETKLKTNIAFGLISFLGIFSLLTPTTRSIIGIEPNCVQENFKKFATYPADYLRLCITRVINPSLYVDFNKKDLQILVGEFIRKNYQQGTILVYDQMGRVPYTAGAEYHFIDSNGLADKRIAHAYFFERSKSSMVLRLYDKIATAIIKKLFPETEFIYSKNEILDYIFTQKPDVILCCSLIHIPLFDWIAADKRFVENYDLKYFMGGVLFFERRGLSKKPFTVPGGLDVVFADEIYRMFEGKNNLLIEAQKTKNNTISVTSPLNLN